MQDKIRAFSSNSEGEKNRNQIISKKTHSAGNIEILRGKRVFENRFLYFCLFLAVLGLRGWAGFSLVVANGVYSLVAVNRLLIVVASPVGSIGSRALGLQ